MKLTIGKLTILWGDKCSLQTCSYYAHYLRHGPPTLNHAAYHAAERQCMEMQEVFQDYLRQNKPIPSHLDRLCGKLEQEVRA